MILGRTPRKLLDCNWHRIAVAGLIPVFLIATQSQAESTPEARLCAALAEARSLILSPDSVIRLGDASDAMKAIEGLTVPSLRLDSCVEHGIVLTVWRNGPGWSYSFDFEELDNPNIWCGFGVRGEPAEVRLPYCRGK
ncbi:MAG: hypothetical protein ACYC0C_11420 [Devosia sp.]